MDIGSSRTEKLLLCRRRDMAIGGSQASDPAPVRAGCADDGCGTTCVTLVLDALIVTFIPWCSPVTGAARNRRLQERRGSLWSDRLRFPMKGSMQIASHPG